MFEKVVDTVRVGASEVRVAVQEADLLPTASGAACCSCCCSCCGINRNK